MIKFDLIKKVLDGYISNGVIGDIYIRKDIPVEGLDPSTYTEMYVIDGANTYKPIRSFNGEFTDISKFDGKEDYLDFIGSLISRDLALIVDDETKECVLDSVSVFNYETIRDVTGYVKLSELIKNEYLGVIYYGK